MCRRVACVIPRAVLRQAQEPALITVVRNKFCALVCNQYLMAFGSDGRVFSNDAIASFVGCLVQIVRPSLVSTSRVDRCAFPAVGIVADSEDRGFLLSTTRRGMQRQLRSGPVRG